MLQGSLLMLWMDEHARVNNQRKIADDGKLTIAR